MSWSFLSSSRSILVHNELEAEPLAKINPHTGDINAAIFDHSGQVVASGGADGSIKLTRLHRQLELLNFVDQSAVS